MAQPQDDGKTEQRHDGLLLLAEMIVQRHLARVRVAGQARQVTPKPEKGGNRRPIARRARGKRAG